MHETGFVLFSFCIIDNDHPEERTLYDWVFSWLFWSDMFLGGGLHVSWQNCGSLVVSFLIETKLHIIK